MNRTNPLLLASTSALVLVAATGCVSTALRQKSAEAQKSIPAAAVAAMSKGVSTIAPNTTVRGEISSTDGELPDGSNYDRWTFEVRAGDQVTIDLMSEDFDAYLGLVAIEGGDWTSIADDDDGGDDLNARISGQFENGGTYHIIANSVSAGEGGSYTLRLSVTRGTGSQAPAQSNAPRADYASMYPGGGNPSDRYALLVGIDDYPGTQSDLGGVPVKDALAMREVLINKFGFQDKNIVVLLDEDANREGIINAFTRHLGQAGPNGVAVFYYSGHGMQLRENVATGGSRDAEEDNVDEALYIYGNNERSSVLVDDEIGHLTSLLKTDRLLLIVDACHSGTGSRGMGAMQAKEVQAANVAEFLEMPATFLEAPAAKGTPSATSSKGLNEAGLGPANHVLLAASSNREVSWTARGWPNRGGSVSVFTYYLAEELDASTATTTWSDLMQRVQDRTLEYTTERMQQAQTPQLEGTRSTARVADFLARR